MDDSTLFAFAEILIADHGPTADLEALKRAQRLRDCGDEENAETWFKITNKIRELQNPDGNQPPGHSRAV